MRKGLIVLLVAVVAVAIALPAMADMTPTNLSVSGFYRSKAYLSNFHDGYSKPSIRTGDPQDMEQTNAFVEQRFRVKFAFGTENVQAVWFLESDNIWGDASGSNRLYTSTGVGGTSSVGADTTGLGAQRNTGGALGADRINTETKNVYVWFKVPDTSLQFTVGLQNQSDAYAGVLYGGADFAGVFMTGQFEPVKYKLGWAKLYENDTRKTDDMTLYVAETNFAPTKEVIGGAELLLPPGRHAAQRRRFLRLVRIRRRTALRDRGRRQPVRGAEQQEGVHARRDRGDQGRPGDHLRLCHVPVRDDRLRRLWSQEGPRHRGLHGGRACRPERRPRQVVRRGALPQRQRRPPEQVQGAHHPGHQRRVSRRELLLQP